MNAPLTRQQKHNRIVNTTQMLVKRGYERFHSRTFLAPAEGRDMEVECRAKAAGLKIFVRCVQK